MLSWLDTYLLLAFGAVILAICVVLDRALRVYVTLGLVLVSIGAALAVTLL